MKKLFNKQLLGIEDIEIGNGKVTQTRGGKEVELDAINTFYDAGLLKDLDRNNLPDNVEFLWFKGFYEEGDKGQGIYTLVPEDDPAIDREDNLGLYIRANGKLYEREGSHWYEGDKKYNWVMIEWFGAKSNDNTYNCFDLLKYCFESTYIKIIECDANKHYYFKQYTDITFTRTLSLEIRGNNAYFHFAIFAGKFEMEIPVLLDYIIMRDINYADIVPIFSFPAEKCRYFNIYHNSNIHINKYGYVYKTYTQDIEGQWHLSELPTINKVNYNDNALVNKAYVDKIYQLPENLALFDGDRNITGFKQTQITLDNQLSLEDLDDDDLITKDILHKWLNDNISSLLPESKFSLSYLPIGFEYLQFKCKYKVFYVSDEPKLVYCDDRTGLDIDYILIDNARHSCSITETKGKFKCVYLGNDFNEQVFFNNASGDNEYIIDYLEEEQPDRLFINLRWRLNKTTDIAKYWERI